MYVVKMKDTQGVAVENKFNTLDEAMVWAKEVAQFVTISGGGYDIVGKFGVDSVKNGLCPDGIDYSWRKRR